MKSPVCSAALALALGACAGDIRPKDFGVEGPMDKLSVEDHGDGSATLTVDARNRDNWVYLDLTSLELLEPDDPLTSADWDLALLRFHFALDGGVSGAGQGELVVMDGAELATVDRPPSGDWTTDVPDDPADEDSLPEFAFETAEGGWYDYDGDTHLLTPKPRVYVIRGADGALFALRIISYYSSGSAAWPRFTVKPL